MIPIYIYEGSPKPKSSSLLYSLRINQCLNIWVFRIKIIQTSTTSRTKYQIINKFIVVINYKQILEFNYFFLFYYSYFITLFVSNGISAMTTKMTATCTWHYICWKVLSQTRMIFKKELILEMDQADKNFEYIFTNK